MKRIINNKKYDTETAREIGNDNNGLGYRDFSHWSETLYCKRTGEYFLHGEGGPMTHYAVSCGSNSWSGGEKIIPLTYTDAREWAEKHLTTIQYEREFGEVTEDDSTTTLTLSMPQNVAELARRKAQESGKSLSAFIADLIRSTNISTNC